MIDATEPVQRRRIPVAMCAVGAVLILAGAILTPLPGPGLAVLTAGIVVIVIATALTIMMR